MVQHGPNAGTEKKQRGVQILLLQLRLFCGRIEEVGNELQEDGGK